MKIRPVEGNDRGEWSRMRAALYPDLDPREVDDWFTQAASGGTAFVGAAVLVAEREGGGLAGFVEIGVRSYAEGCETTPVAFLEGWYVDPDCRRQGLGRALLEAAERWARDSGFREIGSDTQLENEVSLAAHLKLGYREVERQICFKKLL